VWQTIFEFVARLWRSNASSQSEQLRQAKMAMEMTMELALEFKQQLAELRVEVDQLKADRCKDNGTIASLQRQVKQNQEQLKEYQDKLREYELKSQADEKTIASLRQRIEELEARQGDSNAG
jgi:chromosome segregation ATPase